MAFEKASGWPSQFNKTTVTSFADIRRLTILRRSMPVRCKRKIRHATRGVAEAACRSMMRRGIERSEEGRLNVYQCPRCLGWHVGHTRRTQQPAESANLRR